MALNVSREYEINSAYEDFLASSPCHPRTADFIVDIVESDSIPPVSGASECLFRSGDTWAIYRNEAGRLVALTENSELIIDKMKAYGLLWSKPFSFTGNPLFPFVLPFAAIVTIGFLADRCGLLVHSCGVNDNGRGFFFAGTSGAGKSTMAKLWAGIPGVRVLNDDRAIIREINGEFCAFGTPWHGDAKLWDTGRAQIQELFFLKHSEANYVKQLSSVEAATQLFVRCFPPLWDRYGMEAALSFIDTLVRNIPCFELGFVPDKSAVDFVRNLK